MSVDVGEGEFEFAQRLNYLEHVALRSLRIKGSSRVFLPVIFPVAGADCKKFALAGKSGAGAWASEPEVAKKSNGNECQIVFIKCL